MDQLKAVRYFLKVAETSSFTQAANFFGVPASSLSRRVADLEAYLGATLVKRSTRVVKLTEIGEEYFRRMQDLVSQLEENDDLVRSYQAKPAGRLKITSMPGVADRLLVPILERFRQVYPDILIDLDLTDQVKDLTRDGVDIAIRGGYAPNDRVIAVKLFENEFIPVATPTYLERVSPLKHPSDLTGHDAILYRTPIGPHDWLYEENGQWQSIKSKPMLVTNNSGWFMSSLLKGDGIGMVPRWSVGPYLKSGELIEIMVEPRMNITQGPAMGIYMLYQKHRYAVPKIKVAVDFLKEMMKVENVEKVSH